MKNDLSVYIPAVEAYLQTAVPGDDVVSEAMRYSLEGGGKRIRPCLVLEFCRICGGDVDSAVPFAAAVEMLHTYSLIHDDLPCMDDDDMRRGKSACHIRFGYANALLAGDGLLTLAFQTLARAALPAEHVAQAVACLANAAGHRGMILGQTMDLANESRAVSADDLQKTDEKKTGELLRASCVLGCLAAGASDGQIMAAEQFAHGVGLAFQIVDDILDVTGDAAVLGKPVGSDAEQHKNTYVTLYGIDRARHEAARYTDDAVRALDIFGADAHTLRQFARQLLDRTR